MSFSITIEDKNLGHKHLFAGLNFSVGEGERVALIGRNGVGKSTLFRILAGEDEDFRGSITSKKGSRFAFTLQEHFQVGSETVLEYILQTVPRYQALQAIIHQDPASLAHTPSQLHQYLEAMEEYAQRDYYGLEERITTHLLAYGLSPQQCQGPFRSLSGGEKRYVDLAKVIFSQADYLCIDEPTNHMDEQGKAAFIAWLATTRQAVLVITHDRDVLEVVDRIIEIKDQQALSFPGNYQAYLKQNQVHTVTKVGQYEEGLRKLDLLAKRLEEARAKKASSPAAKVLEVRLQREYDRAVEQVQKPSLWLDQTATTELDRKTLLQYERYKDRSIRIQEKTRQEAAQYLVLHVSALSLGYTFPLFKELSFNLYHGNRLRIQGPNGAGKTTFINTLCAQYARQPAKASTYAGSMRIEEKIRIGRYEQELASSYLNLSLEEAIRQVYAQHGRPLTREASFQIMADYLFDPVNDGSLRMTLLSGGQKARFQIISMLANQPDVLILDEPTNHLDLPSIEELERALLAYTGAILYVSHDSYFITTMGGSTIQLLAA